jgi:PAS domain S-box-containing protein
VERSQHGAVAVPSLAASSRGGWPRALRGPALAVGLALAALALAEAFSGPLAGAYFLFSSAAVCLAALAGGTGPGVLALAICAAGYPLVGHEDGVLAGLGAGQRALRLGVFLLVGAAQAGGAGALRRAYARTRRAQARCERRAERQRRVRLRTGERLETLRAVTLHLAEGICAIDRDGRLVLLNPAASAMLGWSEEELAGRSFAEAVRPRCADGGAADAERCPVAGVLRHGRTVGARDWIFLRRDGSPLAVSFSSSPIRRRGRVVGAALAFRDVGAERRAEQADRFLAQATRTLTESIDWEVTVERVAQLALPFLGDWSLVVVDDERGLRSVAAAAADPARAAEARDLARRYPVDRRSEHGVGRVLRTGRPELVPEVDVDRFAPGADGRDRLRAEILRRVGLRSYMAAPLVARGGTLGAIAFGITGEGRRYGPDDLAVAEELAARCALALDNARLYREAREASRTREEVIAVVSHDLRAPLGAVKLGAGLVSRLVPPDAPPELRRAAETLKSASSRVASLVDDLVDAARLEGGGLPLAREPHDAAELAREALRVLEPLAAEQGVALRLDVGGGEEGLPLSCDRHRMLQVLGNLLGNALHASARGGAVELAVWRAEGDVVFRVTDAGPGIAAEDLPRVFDRYWRGARASWQGSGLGLAIAKGLVEAHGGRIEVRSRPGEGATFSFRVPGEPTR